VRGQLSATHHLREVADPFPYERAPLRVSNHSEGERKGYVVKLLRFPSVGENGQEDNVVTVRYYESTAPGRRPLVVILPIWGGSPYPPAIVVSDLLGQGGVNIMRVLGEDAVMDWSALGSMPTPDAFRETLRRMVERVRTTVIDVRRLLDWAESRPAVDARRIGLIGFSESTLQVAGLMASHAQLAAAVLVMGGAHPHEILAACYGPPEAVRNEIMPRFGWTPAEFVDAIEPVLRPIDPARLGSRVEPERVLIVDAERDDCVPRSAREALWDVIGRPTRVSVRSSHAGAFLGMTFLGGNHVRHRIVEFLGQTLR